MVIEIQEDLENHHQQFTFHLQENVVQFARKSVMTRGARARKKKKRNHVVVIICNRDEIEAVQDPSALLRREEAGEARRRSYVLEFVVPSRKSNEDEFLD